MKVLGISCYYHDASAAVVENGEVIAAAAEERFSFQKHDPNFPKFAINFCLEQANISSDQLDAVVFFEEPTEKFTRVMASSFVGFPHSSSLFVSSIKNWMGSKLWIKNEIAKRLKIEVAKVHSIPHHLSHAAQAFLTSDFEQSAILVIDAVGEWSCTSLLVGDRTSPEKIKLLKSFPYPQSLGLVYAAFTGFLGFRVNDGECSTMALASFGNPKYVDQVKKVISIKTDGSYEIDYSYFDFESGKKDYLQPKFLELFGPRREIKKSLSFDCLTDSNPGGSDEEQKYADIAASIQLVLEEALLGLAKLVKNQTNLNRLCYSGGVALNCKANTRPIAEAGFDQVFIPPDPGDGGASQGAALYFESQLSQTSPLKRSQPYLGKGYSDSEVDLIDHLKPEHFANHLKQNFVPKAPLRWESISCENESDLIQKTTEDLLQGKIVGWVQGRFENGPRALGNRSILFLPDKVPTGQRCSKEVKSRAPFRPYALSITSEDAHKVFSAENIANTNLNSWMQKTLSVIASERQKVRAALHIDGTTRPQICRSIDNPRFHKLLENVGRSTGLSALVNTSLNDSGFPLISSPIEALLLFLRSGMDTLVVGNRLIRKEQ